jgi:hypothetical protein
MQDEKYLTRNEAAKKLQDEGFPVAAKTLETMASRGGGPTYRIWGAQNAIGKGGVALYLWSEVFEWANNRLKKKESVA